MAIGLPLAIAALVFTIIQVSKAQGKGVQLYWSYQNVAIYNSSNYFLHFIAPPPAIGDIRLVPSPEHQGYYEVEIYYTDGVERPEWGGICSHPASPEEADVICRQLGFARSNLPYLSM